MKKTFTLIVSLILAVGLMGQMAPKKTGFENLAVPRVSQTISEGISPSKDINPYVNPVSDVIEEDIGTTIYDLQSNSCTPYGRLYVYPDGTKAGVWTMGKTPTSYPDRGTGYNYFNGTQWGPDPAARVETVRTGWPSYAPCGPNGEIVVAHQSGTLPLVVSRRATKGSGSWTETLLPPPAGASGMLWPRMISTGPDNNTIHIIALTAPTANGGTVYQGLDGALLYCRSTDGGVTFSDWQLFPELSNNYYLGFSGDAYGWLIPYENHIAFVIPDSDKDLIIMHSADNGDTWEKLIVWEHPYPFYSSTMVTDRFYCPDGSAHGAIDKYGKIHLAFGVNRAYSDGSGSYWFPWVDGVAYWNSDMPAWLGGDTNALNPDTLFNHGNLIGWMQDINGNNQLDLVSLASGYSLYYLSPTSMPQLIYDNENDIIYCVFVSVTETYNNGSQDYRHIWVRASYDFGATWTDFKDLTGNIFHIFDECVFPVISPTFDMGRPALIYQRDNEPGLSIRGDQDPPTTNYITYMVIDDYVGMNDNQKTNISVSQNYPNPAQGFTRVMVNTNVTTPLSLTLTNIAGQKVMEINKGKVNAGTHFFDINTTGLTPGMYFYTVNAGNQKTTLKMIVK